MTRRIYLYGSFAEKFGSEPLELSAENAPNLLLALKSIFPAWRKHLSENPQLIFILSGDNKENPQGIDAEMIERQFGDATEVHVIPAQEGAGIETAALLMGASEWLAAHAVVAFVLNTALTMVATMALGAIFQALSPTPTTGAGSTNQVAQNQSFLYNGPENVQQQGGPVPLVYGYFMTGSTVISASVDVEQLLVTPSLSVPPANGGGTIQPVSPPAVSWQWTGL